MAKNAHSRTIDPVKLRRTLALYFLLYASVGILALFGTAIFLTVSGVLSQELLQAAIQTYLQPYVMEWLGIRGNEMLQWLTTLLRFSPFVITVLSIWVSFVAGFIATSPHLITAWGLYKGKSWVAIPATIAILMALPVFPIGTALSLFALHTFYKLNRHTATTPAYNHK